MAYGRVHFGQAGYALDGAAVSHLAELVRAGLLRERDRPPHPALRATFSPRGEGSPRAWR